MDTDLCEILLAEDDLRDGVETLERPRGPAKASAPSRRSAVRLLDAVRRVGVSWALPDEPAPMAQL